MKVIVPLAEGLEEIEAVTIIDVLRRAEIDVTTVFLKENPVTGSHNISLTADRDISEITADSFGCVILPGGMPGSANLQQDSRVLSLLKEINSRNGIVAAICAAAIVPGAAGILKGKKATCYPGFEKSLIGAEYIPEPVIVDGNVITGKGPGCAIPFALKLVEILSGKKKSDELKEGMQVYWM